MEKLFEHGYGAPSFWIFPPPTAGALEYDYGFGDPSAIFIQANMPDYLDCGYGSKFTVLNMVLPDGLEVVRNDGGQIVDLISDWPTEGPFRVELIASNGTASTCYGVQIGPGEDAWMCATDATLDKLRFATPPMAVGTYDLSVSWELGSQESILTAAVEVVVRPLYRQTYSFRGLFPVEPYGAAGPRNILDEPLMGA